METLGSKDHIIIKGDALEVLTNEITAELVLSMD
jgi:hypothetical protein